MTSADRDREAFEWKGPYHYKGDVHPSLNIYSSTGRVVGDIYVVDGDMDRAEAEADAVVAALTHARAQAEPVADRDDAKVYAKFVREVNRTPDRPSFQRPTTAHDKTSGDPIAFWKCTGCGEVQPLYTHPAPAQEPVAMPAGWKLVPATVTRDWAYSYANWRQGQSSTPRCEPPGEADIQWAGEALKGMLAAAPVSPPADSGENVLLEAVRFAHDTLWEINPSNYTHDEVCKLNDASVEVILALAPLLGRTHGKSAEWWAQRKSPFASHTPTPQPGGAVKPLREQLEEAEATAAHLRRQIVASTCAEVGHDWRHLGGKNCGCHPLARCSVPVHECARCGDCDYGENRWADEQIAACEERRRDEEEAPHGRE